MSSATQDLTLNTLLALSADQSWTVADGRTLNIGSATAYGITTGSGHTLNINGAGTISSSDLRFNNISINQTAGLVSSSGHVIIGAGGTTSYTISSGILTAGSFLYAGFSAGGSGTFTQNGGVVNCAELFVGSNANGGSYHLNDGTLNIAYNSGNARGEIGGTTGNFYFNGGQLNINSTRNNTLDGTSAAINFYIQSRGANIAITNSNITTTFAVALLEDSTSTGGGLTKTGAGKLVLAAANTYTGVTAINAGTLKVGHCQRLAKLAPMSPSAAARWTLPATPTRSSR